MSFWIIKGPEDSSHYLCDYRPTIECPQWSGPMSRAYKFASRSAAADFFERMKKSWALGTARVVRVTSRLDRRAERLALRAENERLRLVIQTGGAMYRAERACMGIPGGIDAYDGDPKPATPPIGTEREG